METIKELRELLQKEKLEGRERPWGYRTLQRGPSIYITRLLIGTPISPNMLTLLSITLGIIGCFYLTSVSPLHKMAGLGLLYLNLVFDRVDGEVARYKKIYSLRGIFLDEINHLLIPPLFFLSFAYGLTPLSLLDPKLIMTAGMASAIAMIILRVMRNIPYQIFVKKYLKSPGMFNLPDKPETTIQLREKFSLSYSLLRILHQFHDFLMIILIFAFVLILEQTNLQDSFLYPATSAVFVIYAFYLMIVSVEEILKGVITIEGRISELASDHRKD